MITAVFGLLTASLLLTLVRLMRGPDLADRVVALDLLTVLVIAFIAVYSVIANSPVFIDGAIVLALVGFLSTVGYAYYIIRGEKRQR